MTYVGFARVVFQSEALPLHLSVLVFSSSSKKNKKNKNRSWIFTKITKHSSIQAFNAFPLAILNIEVKLFNWKRPPAEHNLKAGTAGAGRDQCGAPWGTVKNQSPQVDSGVVLHGAWLRLWLRWQQAEQHLLLPVLMVFDLTAATRRKSHVINNPFLTGGPDNCHVNIWAWY